MPSPSLQTKHTHKFQRRQYKTGSVYYVCVMPDCYFKVPCEVALNKSCICHRCGDTFIMNQYSIRLAKPHCTACHNMDGKKYKAKTIHQVVANDNSSPVLDRLNEATPDLASLRDRLSSTSGNANYIEYNPDDDVEL